jgi:WD40 repeat protein
MSAQSPDPSLAGLKALVDVHGAVANLNEPVIACAFLGPRAAFALGDGSVHVMAPDGAMTVAAGLHDGAMLCATLGPFGDLITGGDDGKLMRVRPDGAASRIADCSPAWIEAVAYGGGANGFIAAACGRTVKVFTADGAPKASFDCPATVQSIAFDKTGRRLACAHVNGVTLVFAGNPDSTPKILTWKGAHTCVLFSPDGKFIVTAMLENALHGWRLQDGQHFRMPGYPAKIRQMQFTPDGQWLATAGAPEVVLWPFQTADGPMGKQGVVAGELGAPITAVAVHPKLALMAAGAIDGEIGLFQAPSGKPFLLEKPHEARITAMAWSGDGALLAFGAESGRVGVVDVGALMR